MRVMGTSAHPARYTHRRLRTRELGLIGVVLISHKSMEEEVPLTTPIVWRA